nr:hypothetical protein [Tanacetum cinerariifolium]
SQREEHTSDWLRVVLISGLGQTMNDKTYHCVLCYRLGSSPLTQIGMADFVPGRTVIDDA